MEFRRIGSSGLKVSAIGLGCGSSTFAARADEKTAVSIIHHALDAGINYIDSAETYAEGRSETLIGKALAGRRSHVVVGTKFAKDRSVGPDEQRGSRTRVMKAVEGSLRRLATDYIDLYVMHQPDPDTPIEETLRALDDLIRAGKVRYIACSDFAAWQLCTALWTANSCGLESFIASYLHYNLIHRRHDPELVSCCLSYGVGIIPTHALADGFLTGKYRLGQPMPEVARFTKVPQFSNAKHQDLHRYDRILTGANFEKLSKLEGYAKERGRSVGELAIAWLLSHPWVAMVPVGVSRAEQITSNIRATEWQLSAEDIAGLDDILEHHPIS